MTVEIGDRVRFSLSFENGRGETESRGFTGEVRDLYDHDGRVLVDLDENDDAILSLPARKVHLARSGSTTGGLSS